MDQETREFCRQARRTGNILGWALTLLTVMTLALSFFLGLLAVAGPGLGRAGEALSAVIRSDWFSSGGASLAGYAVAALPVLAVLSRVPLPRQEQKRMRVRKFLLFFIVIEGGGTAFNLLGNAINLFVAGLTGRLSWGMNPVHEILSSYNWMMVLYVALLGPVIEEFIFRGQILRRLRPFGDWAAIAYSSLMFGLMHGNITQFLYATYIGTVLGYVAVRTGRLRYCMLLHILVNSCSVALSFLSQGSSLLVTALLVSAVLAMYLMIAASAAILCVAARRIYLERGGMPDGCSGGRVLSALLAGSGTLVFPAICLGLMGYYLLAA